MANRRWGRGELPNGGSKARNDDEPRRKETITSLFVDNIPRQASWRCLKTLHEKYGKVVDVFVPKKKTARGNRFGFVRFKYKYEAERAIRNLNGIWIAGFKLGVNIVRFGGRENYWKKKTGYNKLENQDQDEEDDAREKSRGTTMKVNKPKTCELEFDLERMEDLEGCVVGKAKGVFDASWLVGAFKQQGVFDVWAIRISAETFVIGFTDENLRTRLEEDNWKWLGQWFTTISPWGTETLMENRLIEIAIHGLPLVFWKKSNIEKIVGLWGTLNTVECNLCNPDDTRVCSATMVTNHLDKIDESVVVWCRNFKANVRVTETERVVQWVNELPIFKDQTMGAGEESNEDCGRRIGDSKEMEDEVYRTWSM